MPTDHDVIISSWEAELGSAPPSTPAAPLEDLDQASKIVPILRKVLPTKAMIIATGAGGGITAALSAYGCINEG